MDKKKEKDDIMLDQLEYIRICGHHYNDYEKCTERKESYEKCYKLYYQKFVNCFEELKYKGY